jgi:molecular chaperone Hsp33
MPSVQLNTDVALGVAIPSRNARGRIARLGPVVDSILASHNYPPVVEKLLAEALTLTALFGSLLKEPQGQLTLQAQTEGGIIDLLVCDYLGGERAQLVLFVEQPPEEIVERKLGVGQLLGLHRPAKDRDVRPVGMVEPRVQPLAPFLALGQVLQQQPTGEPVAAPLFSRQPDQARDLLGLAEIALRGITEVPALERHDPLVALVGNRLVEGDRKIALAEQLLERRLALDLRCQRRIVPDVAAQLAATRLSRGCRCDPEYVRSVIARFPADEREAMVGEDGLIRVDCAFCSSSFSIEPGEL